MDVKKKHFELRQQILKGSLLILQHLIENEDYDKVIVVGHSLGSVIAYDTLNKLNIKASVDEELAGHCKKITGLVTFGSPLDKILFFFRQSTKDEEYIRRQFLSHFHSFKILDLGLRPGDISVADPVKNSLAEVRWINFYHENDPISGHLDFYGVNENIERTFAKRKNNRWGIAHLGYWEDRQMYEKIANEFLDPDRIEE